MPFTNTTSQFAINGVIDTNKPVMQNLQALGDACASWVTFDVNEGKWSVVMNRPGTFPERMPKTLTTFGNLTVSTAQKKFGAASALFSYSGGGGGSQDYIQTVGSSTDFTFGTGDFTVEMWIYRVGDWNNTLIELYSASNTSVMSLYVNNASSQLTYYTLNTSRINSGLNIVTKNTWHHIAISRSGNSTRMFVNGVQRGSTYTGVESLQAVGVKIGDNIVHSFNAMNGYIDEIRISKTARYTANFTPATSAFVNDANTVLLIHADTDISDDYGSIPLLPSFDNKNIIGSINISGTGITEFYNKVSYEFPHKDLNDEKDVITFSIPTEDRFPNEVENVLNISTELVTDPVQVEFLASLELKQSRLDKVIQFRTDYSKLGLKAGDLIEVTAEPYGYDRKRFRIISITEEDTEDAGIVLGITALEYSDDLYDTTGLIREVRTTNNGVVSKCANQAIAASESEGTNNDLLGILGNAALAALLLNGLSSALKSLNNSGKTVFLESLVNNDNAVQQALIAKGFMICATAGQYIATGLGTVTSLTQFHEVTFTAPYTARYIGQVIIDQNTSGAEGGVNDFIATGIRLFDSNGTQLVNEVSGGPGAWYWTDFALSISTTLAAGETYTLRFLYTNSTVSGDPAGFTVNWNVFTVIT